MPNEDRYLSPRDMGSLLAELRVVETSGQDGLLEFLEKARIVCPVLRVNWPASIVIEERGGTPAVAPTEAERSAVGSLTARLQACERHNASAELEHPYDEAPVDAAWLLTRDVTAEPFRPWADFSINVRPPGEPPLRVSDGVDTYYHGWQALLIADAVEMGVQILVDTRKPQVLTALMERRFDDLGDEAKRSFVSLRAPRELSNGLEWAPLFDAASRFSVRRDRLLAALSVAHAGAAFKPSAAENAAFAAAQAAEAARRLDALSIERTRVFEFLGYLCERWDEWTRRGRAEMAEAYKEHLASALRLTMSAYGLSYDARSRRTSGG